MNTLENEVDVLLQECAKELIAQDAAVLDATEEIPVPERLRLRAVKAMKKAKKEAKPTSPFFRFARVAVASLVAAVCLATASIVYATYTRPEIWGIDIVDNGDHYVVSILSTLITKNTIENQKEPYSIPAELTKSVIFDFRTERALTYNRGNDLVFTFSQSCNHDKSIKVDDDCSFEEIWIKGNKAVFIEHNQTGRTEVFWFDEEYCYNLVSYEGLDSNKLIEIAESVKQ